MTCNESKEEEEEDCWGGQDGGERVRSRVESETASSVFARKVGVQQLQLDGDPEHHFT